MKRQRKDLCVTLLLMGNATDKIGLRRGTVKLVPYDPIWKELFEAEKDTLLNTIGDYVSDIEHIGSTSIPGLKAKPIIDMIAAVKDLSVYIKLIDSLTKLGYEYMPERVFDDRVFFPKGPQESRTHHLSLVVENSADWTGRIAFRDYLRSNPHERQEYQLLKERLAKQFPNDRASYTKAKESFFKRITISSS